jgi:hypothetical protein
MNTQNVFCKRPLAAAISGLSLALCCSSLQALEPCGDFGECKVLIEINTTDGDAGFHFLVDGDELWRLRLEGPDGKKIFRYQTYGPLREQTLTETFAESAEPLCWLDLEDLEADEDDVVTLADFLDNWDFGSYAFVGISGHLERSLGSTELSNILPAAPLEVDLEAEVDDDGEMEVDYTIVWEVADEGEGHLGRCSGIDEDGEVFDSDLYSEFTNLVGTAIEIVEQPDQWEVVMEPDFNDDPEEASMEEIGLAMIYNNLKFTIRLAGDTEDLEVEVPDEYLEALPANTPVKVEVGAIAGGDNASFTEADGFCVNEDEEEDSYCEE